MKQKLAEEDLGMPLPPALELKAEVRRTLAAISRLRTEAQVREALELLNGKIRKANRTSITGPPTDLSPVRVEAVVDRWKEERGLV